ncbi:hypothetical protein Tsubulata_048928 [Turnera subulata]|uniref:Anaphase-promoting complex subunit 4 WD40 domain-containing protein n=1 Tax=Turnera subulata TaxID=218843 RepID=A0A9Q0FRG4_9ROSI|nr:hypothetical protein Tsubulata_048928 [Turnera subulata]
MGLVLCPILSGGHSSNQSESHSYHLYSESHSYHLRSESSSSLSSQPSLPSVPSLSTPSGRLQQELITRPIHHQCIATLKGHSSYVFSLALSRKFLYSGSSTSEIRAWNRDGHPSSSSVLDRPAPADNIVATSNGAVKSLVVLGDKLFSAHQDNKIRVWKIEEENQGKQHQSRYSCIATLPRMNDRLLRLFSAKNYVEVRRHKKCTWVHHVDTVSALAISKDASFLYSASWDRTFKVWRTSDFRCLESVEKAHDDAINALALSGDGFVYTGSADKKIKVWKKLAGEKKHSLVATIEGHKSAVNALALSTDGSVLYSGACDRSILVWEKDDTSGGHMVLAGALRGHRKAILCLAVVSDLICSGSADNTVRIWRRGSVEKSYSCLAVLEGHRRPVKCLTAAIDSNNSTDDPDFCTSYLVYSGSLDCDIKIWHIQIPIL